ncbi:unnamed protein product [Polarella glacialis]|uniref:Uncharacterized protein n=1 Tax=Polarella glacialis TaxID=89957 RepID=A0A813LXI3_POLGL|nr:unnamed protein product [Polarella glacialis]
MRSMPMRLAAATLSLGFELQGAMATIRMPADFNVEKDFGVKEKYKQAQKYIRCDLCKITVGHTFDSVGETFTEDDVYDHIDNICDVRLFAECSAVSELYKRHELLESTEPGVAKWSLVPAREESDRSEHTIQWQSHSMKELCDNIIRPYDDEIKDVFLRILKAKASGDESLSKPKQREHVVSSACKKTKHCKEDVKSEL